MNWLEFIANVYGARQHEPGTATKPRFEPPASILDVDELETRLHVSLHSDLRALLLESNGVMEMLAIDGGEWFDNMWVVWPTSEIVAKNESFRKGNVTHDDLLFFASAGTDGILFANPVEKHTAQSSVVAWFPIEDELRLVAPSLREFMQGYLLDKIRL
jgi:hypothetical protein